MILIRGLHKRFGSNQVLRGLDLEVPTGETIAIVGPSGTGKSVLLKIIAGFLQADKGEVVVDGRDIAKIRTSSERQEILKRMGVLFQNAALFDSLNLYENVAFPLRYHTKYGEREISQRVLAHLESVGLLGHELALPGEVSIGMRKRVGIARALSMQPDILLFDEPNTGLDPETGQGIYDLIKETQKRNRFTGIVISHEIPEVFQVCSRVAMMYGGVISDKGSVEEFLSSANPVTMQFRVGEVNGPISIS